MSRSQIHITLLSLLLLFGLSSVAFAKADKESYPINGSVNTGLSFNHSNFVSTEASPQAAALGLPQPNGFGWMNATLSTNLSYSHKFSKDYPPIFLSGGLSFQKALIESFYRTGVPTTQPKQFNIQDLSMSAGWNIPSVKKLVKNLNINVNFGLTAPFSRSSRSIGLLTALSSGLSVIYRTPINLVLRTSGFIGYNILENPTIQVDCNLMPQYCQISGEDLGSPNQLMSWGGSFGMQYPLFLGFRLGVSYSIFGGMGAAQFPEATTDPVASDYAQSGNQYGIPFHRASIFLSFGFNQTGSAAQQALNESLKKSSKKKKERSPRFTDRLSFSLSMGTGQRLYSMDNSRITVPIFDFETSNKSRTSYNFGMQIAL